MKNTFLKFFFGIFEIKKPSVCIYKKNLTLTLSQIYLFIISLTISSSDFWPTVPAFSFQILKIYWKWSGKTIYEATENPLHQNLVEKKFMARTKQPAQRSSGRRPPREHSFTATIFRLQVFCLVFGTLTLDFSYQLCEIWAAGGTPTAARQVRRNLFNVIVLGFFEYILCIGDFWISSWISIVFF